MLTKSQFYVRVLEEVLKLVHITDYPEVFEDNDDLRDYLIAEISAKLPDGNLLDTDEAIDVELERVEATLRSLVQVLGAKEGVDVKFL